MMEISRCRTYVVLRWQAGGGATPLGTVVAHSRSAARDIATACWPELTRSGELRLRAAGSASKRDLLLALAADAASWTCGRA